MRRLAAGILALAALGAGCGEEEKPEVRVFAASSLTDVLGVLAAKFERDTGTKVKLNCASSSTLAKQIVEGARCDLFLSADEEWAAWVTERIGPRYTTPFLENRLVMVEARSRPVRSFRAHPPMTIQRWIADREVTRIALGDPEHVPAGRYAKRALESQGLWDGLKGKVVYADSVRSALALVISREADGGIAYKTDAMAMEGYLREVDRLEGVVAVYSLMVAHPDFDGPRRVLFNYLVGPRGRKAFERAGFSFLGDRGARK